MFALIILIQLSLPLHRHTLQIEAHYRLKVKKIVKLSIRFLANGCPFRANVRQEIGDISSIKVDNRDERYNIQFW